MRCIVMCECDRGGVIGSVMLPSSDDVPSPRECQDLGKLEWDMSTLDSKTCQVAQWISLYGSYYSLTTVHCWYLLLPYQMLHAISSPKRDRS